MSSEIIGVCFAYFYLYRYATAKMMKKKVGGVGVGGGKKARSRHTLNSINACVYLIYYTLSLSHRKLQVNQYHYVPQRQAANMYVSANK